MRTTKTKKPKPLPFTLVKRVVALWKADNTSAIELGKALLEVKAHNPHGGLKLWIDQYLGRGSSVRNRCSYCMRLAQGKNKSKGKKESEPANRERDTFIRKVNGEFSHLYDYMVSGDVDKAELIARGIIQQTKDMVETARKNSTEKAKAAHA